MASEALLVSQLSEEADDGYCETEVTTASCLPTTCQYPLLKSALLSRARLGSDIVVQVSCSQPHRRGLGSASRGMAKCSGRCSRVMLAHN
jgi:hypothetical protein